MKRIFAYLLLGFIRTLFLVLRLLPKFFAIKLIQLMLYILRIIIPRLDQAAMVNLKIAFPELAINKKREILSNFYKIFAENLVLTARIDNLNTDIAAKLYDYRGLNQLISKLRENSPNTGILLLTAHFGHFEQHVQAHALLTGPSSILARGFGIPIVDNWLNKKRAIFGNDIFYRKGGYRELVNRLGQGRDVVLLIDQNVKARHAEFASFFGLPAATTKAPALAAIETGAPMIFGVAIPRSDETYRVYFKELPSPDAIGGDRKEKITQITTAINECLEEVIREKPEAWFWIHRRWKTRPNGEPENIYL